MSLVLLLFGGGSPVTTGGGTTTYPSPILLIKKGKLAVHTTANVYLEI